MVTGGPCSGRSVHSGTDGSNPSPSSRDSSAGMVMIKAPSIDILLTAARHN